MSLECLTWIPHLWDKLICLLNVRKDSFALQDFPQEILICSLNVQKDGFSMQDLPEEILIDILSRLLGNCVLERRRVCKQWLALTSTPNFLEMHLKRATPVLFVQFVDHVGKMEMFIFDEGAKANQMIKKMGAEYMHLEVSHVPDLCGSCNGLLLFRSIIPSSLSLVCNPLTGEKVTIRTSVDPVIVCGIFFHPLTNDYKLLFAYHKLLFAHYNMPPASRESVDFEYFLYSLRGQCWRKLDDFPCLPSVVAPPAILNGAVHWMVNRCSLNDIPPYGGSVTSIMMFNMDTEKFSCMPHPRLECPVWKVGKYIRLFEMKGKLAFCHVHSSHVYLWVLEDYENWIWGERYSVNLHLYVKRYPLDITHIGPRYTDSLITLVDIQNDELLFDYRSRGLFRYNLRQKTIKQINGVGMKQMPLLPFSDSKRRFISYTKTFVSPSDFK